MIFFALERADHKRITGKQLGAAHQYQHQAQAKAQTAHDALGTPAQRAVAQEHGKEQATEGNKRTGEHCQQKGLCDRQVGLGHAGGLGLGLDRGGARQSGAGYSALESAMSITSFLISRDKRTYCSCPKRTKWEKSLAATASYTASTASKTSGDMGL